MSESHIKDIKDTFGPLMDDVDPLGIDPDEAMDPSEQTEKKVLLARQVTQALAKLKDCDTANDVFGNFALDAAAGKVVEMITARLSSDRQRAMDTVLDRALGKPMERVMSINMQIAAMSPEERKNKIREHNMELGYAGNGADNSSILIEEPDERSDGGEPAAGSDGGEGGESGKPTQKLCPEPGVSGKLYEVPGTDSAD